MSDRDFANLQAQRDAAPRGSQKANLNKRVQNELARRRGGAAQTPKVVQASDTDRVIEAIKKVEFREHGWAHFDRVRAELPDMTEAQVNRALAEISLREGASMIPEVNQKALTPSQRKASLHIGGEDKHMIQLRKEFALPEHLASRKAGGDAAGASTAEQKVATHQWSQLGQAARKHSGIVGSTVDGVTEVHFPNVARAGGFFDQMRSAGLVAEVGTRSKTVRVHKPG
jgi:hypothetical protein